MCEAGPSVSTVTSLISRKLAGILGFSRNASKFCHKNKVHSGFLVIVLEITH